MSEMVAKAKLLIVEVCDKNKKLSIRPLRIRPANQINWPLQSIKSSNVTTRWEINGMRG